LSTRLSKSWVNTREKFVKDCPCEKVDDLTEGRSTMAKAAKKAKKAPAKKAAKKKK
jgi:hypothetical protein